MITFRDDATAVSIVVRSWSTRGDDSPIRYYKHVGESNVDTTPGSQTRFDSKDFVPSDFLLVMQSPHQSLMFAENPRTLCVDATHGTEDILQELVELQRLLRTKLLPVERQKAILRQLTVS